MRRLARAAGYTAAAAVAGLAAERLLVAAPSYRGPVTDHFDGQHFHNLQKGWQSEGSFVRWMMTRMPTPWPEWIDGEPGPPPPERVGDGRLLVTWVNHATLLVQMDGVNVLTDPMWSDRCAPVSFAGPRRRRAPGIRFEDLPPIDAILVSHNHYDHMDLPTLRRLSAPILTPLGNSAFLRRHGVARGRDLDWWQEIPVTGGVKIALVPARHFCARGLSDRNATLWGGFVVSGPSGNVYFAGDTGWGPHFEEIGRRFAPIRLAMLPIGAYQPQWFMHPAHISPAEAVDAHFALGAKTSLAMHFGTFQLGDDGHVEPVLDLRAELEERGNPPVLIVEHGVGTEMP